MLRPIACSLAIVLALASGTLAYADVLERSAPAAAKQELRQDAPLLATFDKLLVNLVVNELQVPGVFYAERLPDGTIVLVEDAWVASNLILPRNLLQMSNGQFGYAISALPGGRYQLHPDTQSIEITALSSSFGTTDLTSAPRSYSPATTSSAGAYLNYNLSYTSAVGSQSGTVSGAAVEGVVFNYLGSLVSSFSTVQSLNKTKTVRESTFFQKDIPERQERLLLGDSLTSTGSWSRPVRFAGVNWATDFTSSEGFSSVAAPSIKGSAALPSVVDILIDNQKRQSDNVNAGPFQIKSFPTVNGAGQLSVVVMNNLGVQTITTQNFYSTPRLLTRNLAEFSLEAGLLRKNYGFESNSYSTPLLAGTYRRGFEGYTLEGRAEVQPLRQAVGAEVATVLGNLAVIHAGVAVSRAGAQLGIHEVIGLEHTSKSINVNTQVERFSRDFVQIGAVSAETLPRQKSLLGLGFNFYKTLWLSTNLIEQSNWNEKKFSLISANLSIPLTNAISLSTYVNQQLGMGQGPVFGANIVIPLGDTRVVAVNSNRNAQGQTRTSYETSVAAPEGTGIGYRITAEADSSKQLQATILANTSFNAVSLDISKSPASAAVRAGASGSLGIMGGLPFASKRIGEGSFAVVKVGDEANVDVYQSNRKIGTTNSAGLALLPNLVPYTQNKISFKPEDLSFDVTFTDSAQVVTPFALRGSLVVFDIKKINSRLVRLVQANGLPVRAGSQIRVRPSNGDFVVATRGEVYLTELAAENELLVTSSDGKCTAALSAPVNARDKTSVIILNCLPPTLNKGMYRSNF